METRHSVAELYKDEAILFPNVQAVHHNDYDCLKGNNLEMFEVTVHGAMKMQKDAAAMMVLKIVLCNSHIIMFVCYNKEIYKVYCEYKQFIIRQLKPNFMKDYSNTVEISVIKMFCKLPLIKHYYNAYVLYFI